MKENGLFNASFPKLFNSYASEDIKILFGNIAGKTISEKIFLLFNEVTHNVSPHDASFLTFRVTSITNKF